MAGIVTMRLSFLSRVSGKLPIMPFYEVQHFLYFRQIGDGGFLTFTQVLICQIIRRKALFIVCSQIIEITAQNAAGVHFLACLAGETCCALYDKPRIMLITALF